MVFVEYRCSIEKLAKLGSILEPCCCDDWAVTGLGRGSKTIHKLAVRQCLSIAAEDLFIRIH